MKGYLELEKGYIEEDFVDFNQKKYAIVFNIASILIAFAIFFKFRIQSCPIFTISSIIFIAIGIFVFFTLHELIHGFFIWLFSKKRANYKISMFYASASAQDRYFDRFSYIIIALSPVIIISLLLIFLLNTLSLNLYNGILLVLALNVSGAIGDFYITIITLGKNKDTLIRDEGEKMHFYTKNPNKQ